MNIIKLSPQPSHWLLLLGAVALLAEGGVRASGMIDFPLYEANAQIGYIPAANQQGSFLNRNDWQFNGLHMGAPAFAPNPARDVLLVGDSVVYGGNAYRQPDRLGPALQAALQERGGGASVAYFCGQLGVAQCAGLYAPEPASARQLETHCVCA